MSAIVLALLAVTGWFYYKSKVATATSSGFQSATSVVDTILTEAGNLAGEFTGSSSTSTQSTDDGDSTDSTDSGSTPGDTTGGTSGDGSAGGTDDGSSSYDAGDAAD